MTYRIVVKGAQDGHVEAQVATKLAQIFRTSEAQAAKILASGGTTVKKGVDVHTAAKYVAAIESCGARVVIEAEDEANTPASATPPPGPADGTPVASVAPAVPATPALPAAAPVPTSPEIPPPLIPVRAGHFANTLAEKLRPLAARLGNRRMLAGTGVALAIVATGVIARPALISYWQQYRQERVIDQLASVRPSTFGAVKVSATLPANDAPLLDWARMPTSSETMKKALAALQTKDDVTLKGEEFLFLYPYSHLYGAGEEPETEEARLRDELDRLIQASPGVAIAIGEWLERIGEPEEALTLYSTGMAKNVPGAFGKFVAAVEKSGDHLRLARIFAGLETPSTGQKVEDPSRVAVHFGEAAHQDPRVFNDKKLRAAVLHNGPEVAAQAWKALLPAPNSVKISDALTACDEKGSDIADPANRGKGFAPNAEGGVAECTAAVAAVSSNARAWYQLGYALQRNKEWNKAKIAYARSAELGSAMGIGRFWWIELYADEKRGFEMLEAEANAGNIWGEYFRGLALYAGVDSGRDYDKAEAALLKADAAGVRYAEVILGEMFRDKGDGKASLAWYTRSTEAFPHMREAVAQMAKAAEAPQQKTAPASGGATQSQSRAYVRAGAVACERALSFVKVQAIERTNNPYVSLPADCETVPFDLPTTFTKYVRTPTGSDLINVGTPAGTFYVRNYDVAY